MKQSFMCHAKNYQDILQQAKWGKISNEEIAEVASLIASQNIDIPRYTLLHILGESQAVQYRQLVEEYLVSPSDPMLAKMALIVLCKNWNYTNDYLARIFELIEGMA